MFQAIGKEDGRNSLRILFRKLNLRPANGSKFITRNPEYSVEN
jgi:hypothetical protein